MIFSDIIALAKAGYSPADVKELLSIDTTPSVGSPPVNNTPAGGDINKGSILEQPEPKPEQPEPKLEQPEPKPKQPEQPEEPTEEQKRIAELEKALAEAQKVNVNKDLSDKIISDEDKLKELFKGFM